MTERPRFLKGWTGAPVGSPHPLRGLLALASALLVLFVGLQGWWVLTPAPGLAAGPRVVDIYAHQGLLGVAKRLDDAGVIRSPIGFALLAIARGTARTLKAGEYEIPVGTTTVGVLSLLEGGRVLQHAVLLREGQTLAEVAKELDSEGLARAADVIHVGQDPLFLRTIEIPAPSVEGYLFPDTYQFVKGMTVEEMLARMAARMREHLTPEIRAAAEERGLTVHQLLTLASIIEREGVVRSELPLISAVFWNRLKLDMPLQADPTVQFAVASTQPDAALTVGFWKRDLSNDDLEVSSRYNTYVERGLPPGPICSPGLAALEAVANPANTDYLYFVAKGDGSHVFARTDLEHAANVERYRR